MLTEQEMSLCEASLIYPKPSDLELLSSDGAANGLPHQREWLHNSQSGALFEFAVLTRTEKGRKECSELLCLEPSDFEFSRLSISFLTTASPIL
jgi:hypothetical protein